MTLHSLEEILADSMTLTGMARDAGIPLDAAKRLCAALSEIPASQAIRICATARQEQIREANRKTRKECR